MKLRLKGNSIRLRLLQSELARLGGGERLVERLVFPAAEEFGYSLEVGSGTEDVTAMLQGAMVAVRLSAAAFAQWTGPSEVGVYGELQTPAGPLLLAIEKDFACLDGSDEDNADTFMNPAAAEGAVC